MTTAPFKLPLTRAEFAAALEKGQGRALMHARRFGVAGLEALFIHACLHDHTYDAHCEESRVAWLLEIADATDAANQLMDAVFQRLDEPASEFKDASQRCEIAREHAQRGSDVARAYLYRSLRRWPGSNDVVGAEAVIALDGAAGLIRVVECMVASPGDGRWPDEDKIPLYWFDGEHGDGAARAVLDAAAATSPGVARFLQQLDERSIERAGDQTPADQSAAEGASAVEPPGVARRRARIQQLQSIPAADVIRHLDSDGQFAIAHPPMSWGIHAPKPALAEVFEAMLRQSDPARLRKYLRVFQRVALAEFDNRLIRFTEHENAEIRRLAFCALSNYAHADIRKLAIERLSAGRCFEDELQLLKSNYQPGDAAMIENLLQVSDDRDRLHRLGFDLVDVFEANPLPESSPSMLFVYEHSPCTNCRRHAVKVILTTQTAPTWLLEEARYDSSPETRELAANPSTE